VLNALSVKLTFTLSALHGYRALDLYSRLLNCNQPCCPDLSNNATAYTGQSRHNAKTNSKSLNFSLLMRQRSHPDKRSKRGRIAGERFFTGWGNVSVTPAGAVAPYFCVQPQWPTMLFSGPDNLRLLPPPLAGSVPSLIHGSFGSPKSTLQSAYRSVLPFLQGSRT